MLNELPFGGEVSGGARPNRLVLDVTSSVSWTGPPVGIIRVEQELAKYARARRPDIVLAFYEPSIGFRALRPEWADTLLGPQGVIDPIHFLRLRHPRRGIRRLLPSRYPPIMALERRRLATTSRAAIRAIEAAQKPLFLYRRLAPFVDSLGKRIAVVPPDLALGAPLSLGPGDIYVSAGSGWLNAKTRDIVAASRASRCRSVLLCYDIIPLLYPEFYCSHDVEMFRRYWTKMFADAGRVIVNSHRVAADVRAHCEASGIPLCDVKVVPLGFAPRPAGAVGALSLPSGLEPGRFALFVSTVEPRKGHGLLLDVWRRLLADGVPQRHRFKLVFVGRRGWMVEKLLARIDLAACDGGLFRHFADLPDTELTALYRDAAFCLYPSIYEGFGLPIIEAFSFGKAVLASSGGALPETVGACSPCLDPTDADAWYHVLGRWIEDPASRRPYEETIRVSFSHSTWDQAAAHFFAVAAGD